jgi:hypothetical protein
MLYLGVVYQSVTKGSFAAWAKYVVKITCFVNVLEVFWSKVEHKCKTRTIFNLINNDNNGLY